MKEFYKDLISTYEVCLVIVCVSLWESHTVGSNYDVALYSV